MTDNIKSTNFNYWERVMKRRAIQLICLAVSVFAFVGSSHAGWRRETITTWNDNIVTFQVNQSMQRSYFTIYKNIRGMRVYMTFFGTTYPEFKYRMQWDTDAPTMGGTFPDDNGIGWIGGINMKDDDLANGGINLLIYISDFFALQYGKQAEVAINICGHPRQTVGSMPNVSVKLNNANLRCLKVTYPKPQTTIISNGAVVEAVFADPYSGKVSATLNDNANVKYGGGLGGVIVAGGVIRDVTAPHGIDLVVARGRRLRMGKRRLKRYGFTAMTPSIVGGVVGGTITTKGRIVSIFSGNVLGGLATAVNVPAGSNPKVAAGNDANGCYYGRNIRKIIARRGGYKAVIAAGSVADETATSWDFLGSINKMYCGKKKYGSNDGDGNVAALRDCAFISANRIKIVGPGVKNGNVFSASNELSKVVTSFGEFDINADYFK